MGARQLVAEPRWVAGSKARPATWASADSHSQCHAHTQHNLLAGMYLSYYQTAKNTMCVWKRWCWMITIIEHRAKWNGCNSLMLIKIDMLLIIFKPDLSLFAHPASCTLLCKISNNHRGQQSFLCFPKSNCWTQVNVAGSQLKTNKAIALSQSEQSSFQQSERLLFLTVTDSTPISIKMTSCITVMSWQALRYETYQSDHSAVTP